MIEIQRFKLSGQVEWLGLAPNKGQHIIEQRNKLEFILEDGIRGDYHCGPRLAGVRETVMRGIDLDGAQILNHRHFSAISTEEIFVLEGKLCLTDFPSGILGENIVISGIPNLTKLPPTTLLTFHRSDTKRRHAVLAVWGENMPCIVAGEPIEKHYGYPGLAEHFVKAAVGMRGIVGLVYCSGEIAVGDIVTAHIPPQHIYEKSL
jgi:hypothetical protein